MRSKATKKFISAWEEEEKEVEKEEVEEEDSKNKKRDGR